MASEVIKIVDPDNGGGTDYTSLDAWEDAFGGTTGGGTPGDLPAGDEIAIAQCRSSSGTDDTTPVVINGWITDSARYIKVTGGEGVGDFPADGIFDDTKYVLYNNDTDAYTLTINDNYVRFHDFQIKVTETSTNNRMGIQIASIAAGNYIVLDSVFIKGVCSGTGIGYGIRVNDSSTLLDIYNCIVTGFKSGADTGFIGIYIDNCSTVNMWNNTIYGNYYGIQRDAGIANAINCAVFNNDDDINGTVTVTYSALDDAQAGTGNVQISQSADDWAALVVDAAGDDFHVTDTSSELYQTGNGATPKAIFTDDIIGTTRDAVDLNWDIGAYELIVVAGAAGIMTPNAGFWGPTF